MDENARLRIEGWWVRLPQRVQIVNGVIYRKIILEMKHIPLFEQFLNEADDWSFKMVKSYIETIAQELDLPFKEIKKTPIKSYGYDAGTMYNYRLGGAEAVIKNNKVPGAPRMNNVELFILQEPGAEKGRVFRSYERLDTIKDAISKVLNGKDNPKEIEKTWTKEDVDSLIKDLRSESEVKKMKDEELFDIVDGIFNTHKGLEDFIKKELKIGDPSGWFVNKIT